MSLLYKKRNGILLLAISVLFAVNASSQVANVPFGKNRVQYNDNFDTWLQYESQNFVTYWYGKSKNVGHTVIQIAEDNYRDISSLIEYRINDKIEIIVYQDITDMKQTNIGSEEAFSDRDPVEAFSPAAYQFVSGNLQTRSSGNKMFVYFDGSHDHLRRQIREGIAKVFLNSMLFSSNLQEIVQNTVISTLPDWYTKGLVAYIGSAWDPQTDDLMRDVILSGKYKDFRRLSIANSRLAGQAFWNYIALNFGKNEINNLIYLTRINKNIESGFFFVLGSNYDDLIKDIWSYYIKFYTENNPPRDSLQNMEKLPLKGLKRAALTDLKASPDGKSILYVANESGKQKVYIYNIASQKSKKIFKTGYRNIIQSTDYNYPLVAWSPSGNQIAVMYELRDVIKLNILDVRTGKWTKSLVAPNFERVFSIDWWDEQRLILSAMVNGFSDLYSYRLKTRQSEQLTNDFYDDLDATVATINGKKGVLFASNRKDEVIRQMNFDTILPLDKFNLFFYNLEEKTKELNRLTFGHNVDYRKPSALGDGICYLTDEKGIINIAGIRNVPGNIIQTPEEKYITNTDRNVNNYSSNPVNDKFVITGLLNGRNTVFLVPRKEYSSEEVKPSKYFQNILSVKKTVREYDSLLITKPKPVAPPVSQIETISPLDTMTIEEPYLFITPFDKPAVLTDSKPVIKAEDKNAINSLGISSFNPLDSTVKKTFDNSRAVNPLKIIPYRVRMRIDDITTTLDNAPLFGGLNNYTGLQQDNAYTPAGILLKAKLKDLFEDYEVEGGLRIPLSFRGTEFYLRYIDKKNRWDKYYSLYRKSITQGEDGITITRNRVITALGQVEYRYPLDVYTSVRFQGTIRQDRQVFLGTDTTSLGTPDNVFQRVGLRTELVFDNTLNVDLNLMNGTRVKIYGEMVKKFQLQLFDPAKLDFSNGFLHVIGLDARHYQRIDRHTVLAMRLAAETSFGSEKILYQLGGVDQWMFPSFNNDIPYPQSNDYAYRTFATNLRGFQYNIRNGNSYALFNAELRVPIFKYLYKRPIKSNFIRHFQVVPFVDIGTAWQGSSLFGDENPLNIVYVNNAVVSVKVKYFRDPIVAGYGLGIRTMIFGYFLRLDYGWGIETRVVQKPMLHFAMGLDF